jgi:hypothetical protein
MTAASFRLAVDLDLPPAMSCITLIFGNEAGPLMFQKTDSYSQVEERILAWAATPPNKEPYSTI